ncbi:MAG: ATP-binding protein [Actinomycetota bacterium]
MRPATPFPRDAVLLSDTSGLSVARKAAADAGRAVLAPERVPDVELAVSELVTNALEHGTQDTVVVNFRSDPDALVISVVSRSDQRPTHHEGPIAAAQSTGRGLQIVRAVADDVEIGGVPDEVVVTCRFRLAG